MASPVLRMASAMSRALPTGWVDGLSRSRAGAILRKLVNASAPAGKTEVTVAAGPLQGARLRLDLRSEKYYWLGSYEPDTVAAIAAVCKEGDVVYDVGANIGYTALLFGRAVGESGRVVAFEPLPANAERVVEHIQMNRLESRVTVEAAAVSSQRGKDRFLVHDLHGMGKLEGSDGRTGTYAGTLEVDTIALDDYAFEAGRRPPSVIKLDIEGGGAQAMAGMKRVLAEARPVFLAELHGPEEREVVVATLRDHGYDLREMRSGLPPWRDGSSAAWKSHVVALPPGGDRPNGTRGGRSLRR